MDLASKFPESSSERNSLLDFAAQLVDANLKYIDQPDFRRDKQVQIGFLLGATGVHVIQLNILSPWPEPTCKE